MWINTARIIGISFGLILLLCFRVSASKTDSLRIAITASKVDSATCNLLNELSWELKYSDISEARKLASEALSLSQRISYLQAKGRAYNILGVLDYLQGNYIAAEVNLRIALKIRITENDKEGELRILNNLGLIRFDLGDYGTAIDYHMQSLRISESLDNKSGIASSLNNIGNIFQNQGNLDKALEYFQRSLKINTESADIVAQSNNLNNIGSVYFNKENFVLALDYYFQSLYLKRQLGNKEGEYNCMGNIGNIYMNINQLDSAEQYLIASLKGKEKLEDNQGIPSILLNLGYIHLKNKKYEKALKDIEASKEAALDLESEEDLYQSYYGLAEVYDSLKQTGKAYYYFKKYSELKDSVLKADNMDRIASIQSLYESEKRDKKISILNKDKELLNKDKLLQATEIQKQKTVRNSFIGGFILLVFSSLILLSQKSKINRERKKSDHLLLNILPASTAEELKLTGKARTIHYESVSVMFTDFINFTKASEILSPEELVHEINYCYSQFDQIVNRYGVEKIKTIGDSYMCAGGLPKTNSTHAIDVVQVAMEMQDFMNAIKIERQKSDKPFFEIRIGIHSGPVVAGVVGINKFAFDIWGDTVNIAARMESAGKAGQINVSAGTYSLIKNQFPCEFRGKIEAKNKGEIEMYFVKSPVRMSSDYVA